MKWLASLRTSRRKAANEAAECFENVVTKRVKTYEDSIIFLQNQLQEKERQFAELSEKYQKSMEGGLELTRKLGECKLKYRQSRCDRKDCPERQPPFSWMRKGAKKVQKVAAIIIGMLLLLPVMSCTRKVYIPVEKIKVSVDSVARLVWRHDTVIERDSVTVFVSGDTLLKESWRFRERVVVRLDTVQTTRLDTIIRPEIIEVGKRSGQRSVSCHLMTITAIILAVLLLRLFIKKK